MNRRGISLAYSELEEKPALARRAEEAGFDIVWNSGESIPLFGAMAGVTSQARFGSGVIRVFAHEARELAQAAVDLQRLSGNRFVMGLGGGTKRMNINQFGKEFDRPATRIRELIRALRVAWATPVDQALEFEGSYYQLTGRGLLGGGDIPAGMGLGGGEAPPAPRETPIYLAAVNRAMLRLAGEYCQGLCGHPIASVRFMNDVAWPGIDEGLARAGRSRGDFDHNAWIVTAIASNRKQAKREAKYHIGRFMATRSYGIVLDSQGYSDVRLRIQEAFFGRRDDPEALIDAVPDEVAREHAIFGTPDEVREQAGRYEGVVGTSTFYCASALMSRERIRENIGLMIETFGLQA
ncbi:MAG: LLM class flavin-dependent oxidoreductase [Chloroflexi bacterium]|nr:LLM class flavin-dependent oxidoreductase [Chloroflexota bacterium]